MAVAEDNRRIIANAVGGKWYQLTKRADIPPLPVWLKIKYTSPSSVAKKIYGTSIPWACFWHGNRAELYLHGPEYRAAIAKVTHMFYSLPQVKRHVTQVLALSNQARSLAVAFDRPGLNELSNKQLLKYYQGIAQAYAASFAYGFITWCTQVIQFQAREIVLEHSAELRRLGFTEDAALGELIHSRKRTIYRLKEQALDKLSRVYQRKFQTVKRESYLKENYPYLHSAILRFLRAYQWVGYEYNGPVLSFAAVVGEISQRRARSVKLEDRPLLRAVRFTVAEKQLFSVLALISHAKDIRNTTDDYVHFCLDKFYSEVARRAGMTRAGIKFLWDDEIIQLLHGKQFSKAYLVAKRKECAAISMARVVRLRPYYVGMASRKLRGKIAAAVLYEPRQSVGVLQGMVAAPGKVQGRVKLVYTYADVAKVKKGDVVVAYMTSPKFMPALMRCAAIVTNDGGLTSHAAIIARELRKPCVVGTKVATEVYKDGDLIEVDALSGVVRLVS